ncbi:MAG: hypothetical protein EA427_14490 [Spirochaetaceae bacterium]|nr:MAG: hypothetical protein EA427_14490 [Spirochaetaceae bacterium]
MSSARDDYVRKAKAILDQWNAEIGVLEVRIDQIKADARIQYQKKLEDARRRRYELKQRLDEVGHAGEEAWGALSDAVKSAKSKSDS